MSQAPGQTHASKSNGLQLQIQRRNDGMTEYDMQNAPVIEGPLFEMKRQGWAVRGRVGQGAASNGVACPVAAGQGAAVMAGLGNAWHGQAWLGVAIANGRGSSKLFAPICLQHKNRLFCN